MHEPASARVYLCGPVTIEHGDRVVSDAALAGPQGRLLLAFLGTRRTHAVAKTQVIEAVWGGAHSAVGRHRTQRTGQQAALGAPQAVVPRPHGIVTEVGT